MSRWRYFFKRLLLSVPVLFLVMTFIFALLRMGPIDPVAARLGPEASGAEAARMRERLGLNDPLWEQYLDFVTNFLTLDLGQSWVIYGDMEVTRVISFAGPPTLWLGFWAILLPLFIGIPLGFYAGLRPNSGGDYVASVSGILWQAMPNFWLSIILLAVLRKTKQGGWFGFDWYTFGPDIRSITGTPDLTFVTAAGIDWGTIASDIKLILPPALVLGSASMAAELRIGRTAILETINSNYVETAKAKGLTDRAIIWKHVFRNALIPLVPVITNEAFLLIGGSVIVEYIFNINGLGKIFFQATLQGDLPLAGALLFIFTLVIILLNIFQDLLYTIIDPRVGYER
ncbi:ABC-type dipeptide/oligopeptide/nickel transport system, permease component [Natrinema pellirubrum DSM 15624]|uniref:ABC-type dipeptide/oligopeptide/nickel transport system, permease component n=2 Tax=Natrinema pellirubrum (strain DSM 15624 / CIP 106293 / JCM 10476 / NCIMB 786 / 157) TaxID=797303 RepID=L0JMR6_NATP1|nr:ABC transporter permease [Natrinema pellirubrum]AGB32800.1 ABC-type dipeptide/oligopeptide/nickel transport system, permease component [Natrinema pellirubrum DSM 15624]